MAPAAREALDRCRVVVGYKTYIDLIGSVLKDQEVVATGMMREVDRCEAALDRALENRETALVSGGDAGIYAMAGLVLDICRARGLRVGPPGSTDVDLLLGFVPGIPALAAAGALLGAPLMTDFASISLSDLLTPWDAILKRVEAASMGDFVIVLYNPKSKKRDWQLEKVREVILRYRGPETPVGIVQKAMREGQCVTVCTLDTLPEQSVDMQTLVVVGNSATYAYGPYMVTPRGYLAKYDLAGKSGTEGAAKASS